MNRTVKENFANRLLLQKKEADVQGLTKVAQNLDHVMDDLEIRSNDESYSYEEKDVKSDVQKSLWSAAVRVADYYDCNIEAPEMQEILENFANNLMHEVRVQGGVKHGVGAYESSVPGESFERPIIEIE